MDRKSEIFLFIWQCRYFIIVNDCEIFRSIFHFVFLHIFLFRRNIKEGYVFHVFNLIEIYIRLDECSSYCLEKNKISMSSLKYFLCEKMSVNSRKLRNFWKIYYSSGEKVRIVAFYARVGFRGVAKNFDFSLCKSNQIVNFNNYSGFLIRFLSELWIFEGGMGSQEPPWLYPWSNMSTYSLLQPYNLVWRVS